jgi:hypothetical protein
MAKRFGSKTRRRKTEDDSPCLRYNLRLSLNDLHYLEGLTTFGQEDHFSVLTPKLIARVKLVVNLNETLNGLRYLKFFQNEELSRCFLIL